MFNAFHVCLSQIDGMTLFYHIHVYFCILSLLIGKVEDKKELEKLYGPVGTPPKEQGEYKTKL